MSELRTDQDTDTAARASPDVSINPLVLHRSKLPFTISLAAFVALLLLIFMPALVSVLTGKDARILFDFGPGTTPTILFLAMYLPHMLLFVTTIMSGYVGYKLVVNEDESRAPSAS
jgi:hypothetical protein